MPGLGPGPGHWGSPPNGLASTHHLPLNSFSKQLDHILAFHSTAPKPFSPGNEGALGAEKPVSHSSNGLHKAAAPPPTVPMPALPHPVQACLVTREGEVETKLQALIAHGECIQELRQAASSKVKELWTREGSALPTRAPATLLGPKAWVVSPPHLLTRTQHHLLGNHKLLAPGLHPVPLDARQSHPQNT